MRCCAGASGTTWTWVEHMLVENLGEKKKTSIAELNFELYHANDDASLLARKIPLTLPDGIART